SLQRGLADLSLTRPHPTLPHSYPPLSPHFEVHLCRRHWRRQKWGDERWVGRAREGVGRRATLIVLGDQPQVQESLVQRICAAFTKTGQHLIMPSFQMRRGHPWLVARPLWPEILALHASQTPRDFINAHREDILYLPVETDSILMDVDTPDDHERLKPRA
ncbi:MAG: hypothetical protein C0393_09340, partial [Anaerolinea sp.]|nr:hypothetical protein [Anaerolinea sp.]